MTVCKLCKSTDVQSISPPKDNRTYFLCNHCKLIFVSPEFFPSRIAEINRYLEHENAINNQGYVDFLNRVIQPAVTYLTHDMTCLDYGCGHTPVLSELLRQQGFTCYNYDPLFGFEHPFNQYDLIFATESFEHFFDPAKELNTLCRLLKPKGYLAIMTEQWESIDRFNAWYYKRDHTHVSFYHMETMEYICQSFGFEVVHKDKNRVIILKRIN